MLTKEKDRKVCTKEERLKLAQEKKEAWRKLREEAEGREDEPPADYEEEEEEVEHLAEGLQDTYSLTVPYTP